MKEILSNNVNETINIAKNLASKLKIQDIIVLTGNLGAGKTYFTKGIVEYFLDSENISSPTFTIVNEYNTTPPIYHFDVYRIKNSDEFMNIGGDEYFNKGICIIEWGEKIKDILYDYLEINIEYITENTRRIQMIPHGKRYEDILKEN
ncbi:MAG: tRNA (adenosine(37)-N6)-threonylcarbamoyltransferase complex ATPase subunit type 1 TsaE [Clostridia bacterium]|nr:tRNA (adenosine(37)-N6)-threonylcarbamoyltransferase complex ATPase subunit type 1 TsaE [Clostridia bacterium]